MAFAVAHQAPSLSTRCVSRSNANRAARVSPSIALHTRQFSQLKIQDLACRVAAPEKAGTWHVTLHDPVEANKAGLPLLISPDSVRELEAELAVGAGVAALRRFNDNLRKLPADRWEEVLKPVFAELCFNLESFNPAFTACLLAVQRTIGKSDYVRRDVCLKNLIQPLAGEYGMHNGEPQQKTHRELFADFYFSLFGTPLEDLIAVSPAPPAAETMYSRMMDDLVSGGGHQDVLEKASYCVGYNLAIEYLADFEKTWMLDSFRQLDRAIFQGEGKTIDWLFLEVHAEGEAQHAAIGHSAALNLVPESHRHILCKAMADHDRDFAVFYNHIADLLEC